MKVILRAFEILEKKYDAPIEDYRRPLYFIHRNPTDLSSMLKNMDLSSIPDPVFKKARFEWRGKRKKELPVFEFMGLE